MFLQGCVKNSVHGCRGVCGKGGGMCGEEEVYVAKGGMHGEGVCVAGGVHSEGW